MKSSAVKCVGPLGTCRIQLRGAFAKMSNLRIQESHHTCSVVSVVKFSHPYLYQVLTRDRVICIQAGPKPLISPSLTRGDSLNTRCQLGSKDQHAVQFIHSSAHCIESRPNMVHNKKGGIVSPETSLRKSEGCNPKHVLILL